MTVQQVIDLVKMTELKNAASIKDDTEAVLSYINLALIEIYKRFSLQTDEVIITLGVNGDINHPYTMISDTIYQMPSNYMYLISAYEEIPVDQFYDENTVKEIPINEEDNFYSVNTVSWNRVQIPATIDGQYISLIYSVIPPYYTLNDLDSVIPIPIQMLDIMLAYIGWKGYSSIDPSRPENVAYYQKFETACNIAREYGVQTADDMFMNKRVYDRGFV